MKPAQWRNQWYYGALLVAVFLLGVCGLSPADRDYRQPTQVADFCGLRHCDTVNGR